MNPNPAHCPHCQKLLPESRRNRVRVTYCDRNCARAESKIRGILKEALKQPAAFTRPCARCHKNPRYDRGQSYCRECRSELSNIRWGRIRSGELIPGARIREYEVSPHVPVKRPEFECNHCSEALPNVRALMLHKREHATFELPAEMYSLIPSTQGWNA